MILEKIAKIVDERMKTGDTGSSYVASLHRDGLDRILKKIAEENFELILAAKAGSRADTVHECADLLFHLIVMLSEKGIGLSEVYAELERRFGTSGIEEKKSRRK